MNSNLPADVLQVIHEQAEPDLASVFVARLADGACIEFVESVQPPVPADLKWVNIVSVLRGCPVNCAFCDAGGSFAGIVSAEEMLAQIDHLVMRRFPDGIVPVPKWKIQFARMGDPAFNPEVVRVIEQVGRRYGAPGFHPSISTIAPASCERFFEELVAVKRRLSFGARFQLQFSLHITCEDTRRALIPVRLWSFAQIAAYGERWFEPGDRRITLNFALQRGVPFEPARLADVFPPDRFLLKITPVNPTRSSLANGIQGAVDATCPENNQWITERCVDAGYAHILSIGELAENRVGSNCGMYLDQAAARPAGAARPARS
ncbi:MAG: radical SAM protein [Deltaproteobacteria bacterium HGW-Deltaproteobacteria-17]|nr:MAG: radical SAM protein [Deltaproteobacteria bacterium HGW-Deltaproteobacteria-17]